MTTQQLLRLVRFYSLLLLGFQAPAFAQPATLCGGGVGGLPSPWTRSIDGIHLPTGRVGIGTDDPTYTLDVHGSISASEYLVGDEPLESLFVKQDEVESVSSEMIRNGTIGGVDVNLSEVQARVEGSCAPGQAISRIAADGSVECKDQLLRLGSWGIDYFDEWNFEQGLDWNSNCAPDEIELNGQGQGFSRGKFFVSLFGELSPQANSDSHYELWFQLFHDDSNSWKKIGSKGNYPDGSAPFHYSVIVANNQPGPIRLRWNCFGTVRGYTIQKIQQTE